MHPKLLYMSMTNCTGKYRYVSHPAIIASKDCSVEKEQVRLTL